MVNDVEALAEGWIVADSVTVTPKDVQPGQTIYIRAKFTNQKSWLPAYGVLQLRLDGAVIETYGTVPTFFGPGGSTQWDTSYVLPSSIASGVSHRIEALEQDQEFVPYADFTVTSPAPPGQRNVSFSSIPAGAEIYVSEAYRGDTPLTIPLTAGTYAVTATYAGKEQTKNISVTAGDGTMPVAFTFAQGTGFDLGKWISDNQWYLVGGAIGLGIIILAVKKPDTVKRGFATALRFAVKGYSEAKEAYKKSVIRD